MVFTPVDNQAQHTNITQNIPQSASPSGNAGGDVDTSFAPTQVRDAFSRSAEDRSHPVNDSPGNSIPITREAELEDDNQFVEEHETSNNPSSVLFVIHSRTKKLEGGFQPISPPDEGEPHIFTQHNVRDEDWAKFLTDLQDSAKLHDPPSTPPPSSLPGLFSTLNLGEGSPPIPSTLASSPPVQPAMVIKSWNKHYFHPRGLDIVLAKGPRSISGDITIPPPDFSEPSAAFDRGAFGPSFHPHGFPHPPSMHPPPLSFMGGMPPTHMMHGFPPFPDMHYNAPPPMHGLDQQFSGPDFMNPRGGFRGRGGRGGPGDRGRGFSHFFGGRGGFGMPGMDFGMGGRGGLGSRGRSGGPRGRGGFANFGRHPHHGFSEEGEFGFAAFEDDGKMDDIIDLFDAENTSDQPADGRKRSHSVCSVSSDSATSTSDEAEKVGKQEKGKGRIDKPDQDRRRGSHDRHGHGHSHHRRGDRSARHERDVHRCRGHHKGSMDAMMAHKFACKRGRFDRMSHCPGMRGGPGGFGHSFIPHHHCPGMFSDDGYYRLIVVDRQV